MTHFVEELGRTVRVEKICAECAIDAGAERRKLVSVIRKAFAARCDKCEFLSMVTSPEEWGLQ